jgi:integrase
MRKKTAIPVVRVHKGQARLRLDGRVFYFGRLGSPEAVAKADRLIAAWLANGRRLPDDLADTAPQEHATPAEKAQRRAATVAPQPVTLPAVAVPPIAVPVEPEGTGITVGELCELWIAWIKAERVVGKEARATSILFGARQAAAALRHHWAMRAADFGPRALYEVQAALVTEPCRTAGKRKKEGGKKTPPRYRTRKTVNDVVGRVRQLFKWAVGRELVPEGRIVALQQVAALMPGQTTARDNPPKRPVPDEEFLAALQHLPPVLADLLRVVVLTGCRTGEACQLTRDCIDMKGDAWEWRPKTHKSAWRGHERVIFIGPRVQAILRPYIVKADGDTAFLFSPREAMVQLGYEEPSHRVRDHYDTDSVRRAIVRACEAHGIPQWTPHRLRHTRLTNVRNEFGLDHAQAVGGHRHASVTEIYAAAGHEKAREVALQTG